MLTVDSAVLQDLDYYMPDEQSVSRLAQFFSIFSDYTRLRLLTALAISPMCVTDLAKVLDANQTTVSHQLRTLRDLGAVNYTRQGKVLKYSINNSKINDILLIGVEYLGY